jgi:hypothetical protein
MEHFVFAEKKIDSDDLPGYAAVIFLTPVGRSVPK